MSKTETQNEREMLEAAARALGLASCGEYNAFCGLKTNAGWFHPRVVGDDVVKLAAALRISVEHNDPYDHHPWVCASVWTDGDSSEQQYLEDVPDESQRAYRMRLAILRCAAAQAPKEQA